MERLKGNTLGLGCFRLNQAEKRYILRLIEQQLLFYDSIVVSISKKDLGDGSEGGAL